MTDNELFINNDLKDKKKTMKNYRNRSINNTSTPWIEKYRPMTIDELSINENTYNKISKIIDDKDMPNIIITGLPGIGKTTTILCIAKALMGRYYSQGVLELNASDDRGIKAVQEVIIYFCKKKLDNMIKDDKYANHKIILLDEADNMTKKAQQLINNLMEKHHDTTRFALTCNNSSKIIEAIQSRCIIFRYKRLDRNNIVNRLQFICKEENVLYTNKGLDALVLTAQGDMRQAINNLQLTYNGYKKITSKNVYKLCDRPHPLIIKKMFIACNNKDIKNALLLLDKLRNDGYSSSDIALSMKNILKIDSLQELSNDTKIKYMIEIGKTAIKISRGVDSPLQLTGCVCKLCHI